MTRANASFAVSPDFLRATGAGECLPEELRHHLELAFGVGFGDVRVHVGPQAAEIGATAFALGSDLYFAPGQYQPQTAAGRRLLGHELAHVVQQRQGRARNPFGNGVAVLCDPLLEAEADLAGQLVAEQGAVRLSLLGGGVVQTIAVTPESPGVLQAQNGLLGEGRLSPQERRNRVFAVMWNSVGDLQRRLALKAQHGERPSLAECREFNDLMNWGRDEGIASVAPRLAPFTNAVQEVIEEARGTIFDTTRAERQRELAGLRGTRVRDLLGPGRGPRLMAPRLITIRVGVLFRIDSRGTAHDYDKQGVEAINRINELGLLIRVRVEAVPLPSAIHLRGSDLPHRPSGGFVVYSAELRGIDMLYIPGAPAAITAQVATTRGSSVEAVKAAKEEASVSVAKSGIASQEATSRGAYELGIIAAARVMGVPIIAICAGSWRLLQAYNGEVRTLPKGEREHHKDPKDVWGLAHAIGVTPGTLLHDLLGFAALHTTNSTHWAVAVEQAFGYLAQHLHDEEAEDPSRMLRISARTHQAEHEATIEAFETRSGAPHLGIQWHPESYLPGMLGYDSATREQRLASGQLFRGAIESSATRRHHRAVIAELAALNSPLVTVIRDRLHLESLAQAQLAFVRIAEELGAVPTPEELRDYLNRVTGEKL